MLKPFFIKKKNIDNRLVPFVSAADAGKVLGVTEDGKIAAVEASGGGGGNMIKMYADQTKMGESIADPTKMFYLYSDPELTQGYYTTEEIPKDGYFYCAVVANGAEGGIFYPYSFSAGRYVAFLFYDGNLHLIRGDLLLPSQ